MRTFAFAAALFASTSVYAQDTIGVNLTNADRLSPTALQSALSTQQALGVRVIRASLEKYNGSYTPSLNLFQAAWRHGIRVNLIIAIANNPDYYPAGTAKRPADPNNPVIYAAYPLSALVVQQLTDVVGPLLQQIDGLGIKLAGIELGNEIGNPAFNGDLAIIGPSGGVTLGLRDLINGATSETQALASGYRTYVQALAAIQAIRDNLVTNQTTPVISAGLHTPGDTSIVGYKLPITEDAVLLNAALSFMRANGLDNYADQYGVHAYLWGSQSQIANELQSFVLTQCAAPGSGAAKPCAITEWGFQVGDPGQCPANDGPRQVSVQSFRTDTAAYGSAVASQFYFDWSSLAFGIYLCGSLQGSGVIALSP
jgi:hypothetical protein